MACSIFKAVEFNPAKSRIQILRNEMLKTILVCQQCDFLFCASVCPKSAMHPDKTTGVVLVDEELCIGCKACLKACLHQAVAYKADRKKKRSSVITAQENRIV
jgi:Fe-S-cluster-containing dehydrogenase component